MDNHRTDLARHVIQSLGGVSAVARMCGIKQPSVSGWKQHGIPQAREQYLRLLRPDAFRLDKKGG
jgi:hypothetical protein